MGNQLMKQIIFRIPGEPVAQGRPRFTTVNGHARAYDAPKSADFKNLVSMLVAIEMQGNPPSEKPFEVSIYVVRSIPSSWSKKKKLLALEGTVRPAGRPDIDNYIKAVFDGLNGIAFKDDSQVIHVTASKTYGEKPGTTVTLAEIQ